MKKLLTIFALIFLSISCGEDDPVVTNPKGSIFATVKFMGQIVSDAEISTEPIIGEV